VTSESGVLPIKQLAEWYRLVMGESQALGWVALRVDYFGKINFFEIEAVPEICKKTEQIREIDNHALVMRVTEKR
jgi:hypothetical protein